MDRQRIDLTPLAPEDERLEPLVAAIMGAAAGELARRAPGSALLVVAGWARPMLRIAAAVILISTAALALLGPEETAPSSVAEAFDVPAPVSEWLATEREPTTHDLLLALEDGR